ncbi:uncharacterized protein LOC135347921 [Halichondria panicea]|uniref:uncharacterized protein LOC135347921 n=1 Tax=Halichondria panicea TaxID=6063 RepID=UPI00312BB445
MASLTRVLKRMLVLLVFGSLSCVLIFRKFVIKQQHLDEAAVDNISKALSLHIHPRSKEKLDTSDTTYSPVATSEQGALAVHEVTVDTNSHQIISKFQDIESITNFRQGHSFKFDSSFNFPWQNSESVSSILIQPWFQELKTILSDSIPRSPIVLVATDNKFKTPLLNWLLSATVRQEQPVDNILVLTYSTSFCDFVHSKKVSSKCLAIPPETLTAKGMYEHKKNTGFYQLLVIRVFVMRLLNYWGYDVANFDSDAILLKNPIPLFHSEDYATSDVIGTFGGSLPGALHNKWGVVVCMGAIFLRSTKQTEQLWKSFEKVEKRDDQMKLNYGLDKMNVKWKTKNLNPDDSNDTQSIQWEGKTTSGLTITLLPQRLACRGVGCRPNVRDSCYIWHHGKIAHDPKRMMQASAKDNVWFYKNSPN